MKVFVSIIAFLLTAVGADAQCGYYFKSLTPSFNKVKFWDETHGVILGYQAALLSTADGGKSWQNANIPMFQSLFYNPLNEVSIADETTGYVVGSFGFISKTTDKGRTWKRLLGITGDEDFKGVYFWNNQNGIVTGDNGLIYKTADGGNSWRKISNISDGTIFGVCFADAKRGFFWDKSSFYGYRMHITSDAGETWQVLPAFNNKFITKMQFLTPAIGYLSVHFSTGTNTGTEIYKTTDGGLNWIAPIQNGFGDGPAPFSFADKNTGFVAYSSIIRKTTDGAASYSTSLVLGKYKFNDIYFTNANVGYAVGTSNSFIGGNGRFLVKTTDGGNQWIILDTLHKQVLNNYSVRTVSDIYELSPTTKFISTAASGERAVFVSRDGGSSWQGDSLLSTDFISGTGFMLKSGTLVFNSNKFVYSSVDSGKNWTKYPLNLPGFPDPNGGFPFPISWISSDTFFMPQLSNTGQEMYYTTNRAASWSVINLPTGLVPFSKRLFKFINKDTAYLSGYVNNVARLYRTYNRGGSWQNLNYPDSAGMGNVPIDPDLINDSTVISRASNRRGFYKTTNRGNTWTLLPLPANQPDLYANMYDFYSEKSGAFSDNNHGVYTTSDSGKTWFMQLSGLLISDYVRGVKFGSQNRYYVYGDYLRLEQYNDYIPAKPSPIKGPTLVKKDMEYEYIIPLDLFSYDTKWEATGNAQLVYDSVSPERIKIKWSSTGSFKVIATAKNNCGISDTAQFSVTVSLTELPTENAGQFVAYPNPAQNILYLKFKQPYAYDLIRITDMGGRVLITRQIVNPQLMEVDLKTLQAGVYILTAFSKDGKEKSVKKLVKL